MNRFQELVEFLQGRTVGKGRTRYECIHADPECVIFGATAKTGKVMLPTDLVFEWVQALEFGLIAANTTPRKMRDVLKNRSQWAAHLHGFETHLHAVVEAWHDAHS